jgi:hypothetical protein
MLIGDSAFPPATYPTEFQGEPVVGWCVYIPGGDAYHGWSQAEIDHLKSLPWCRYILPVFVRSNPQGARQATTDAATVVAWAHAQGQPRGTLTMWDAETAVDAPYELTFDTDLRNEDGDLEIAYGSKSTVLQMPTPSGGDDVADWTGNIPSSLASMAEQFYSGPDYDLNKFRTGAPLWDLRPVPTAPTSAPTAHSLEEDTMAQAIDGQVDIGWSKGDMAVVQVSADGGAPLNKGAVPHLRVTLHTRGGAVVLAGASSSQPPWQPTEADPVMRFDAHKADAFGITLEAVGTGGGRYAAIVAP